MNRFTWELRFSRILISHRFPLKRAIEAFQLNTAYRDKVVKVMVES